MFMEYLVSLDFILFLFIYFWPSFMNSSAKEPGGFKCDLDDPCIEVI